MTDLIASAAGGFGRLKIQNVDISGDIQAKNARKEHPPQLVIDPRGLVNHLGLKRAYGNAGLK